MLVLSHRLVGLPLLNLRTGSRIGIIGQPLIDPRNLQIAGFYCEGPNFPEPRILRQQEIREVSMLGVVINSIEDTTAPSELVRLRPVIDINYNLIGKRVINERGSKVGKVNNYTVDTKSLFIVKLHAKPTILKAFATSELLIHRTQVVKLTDQEVVIKSDEVTQKAAAKPASAAEQGFVNPFRKPQPEARTQQD